MSQKSQLVIIGGPSCSGKSFLINKIKLGECPCLCEQLGIDDPCSWSYALAREVPHVLSSNVKRLVVHYDLNSRYSQETDFDYLHELINSYDNVIILTLCVSSRKLMQRNRKRMIKLWMSLLLAPFKLRSEINRFRSMMNRQKINKKNDGVLKLYEKWFSATTKYNLTSYWLDSGMPYTLLAQPYETDKIDFENL